MAIFKYPDPITGEHKPVDSGAINDGNLKYTPQDIKTIDDKIGILEENNTELSVQLAETSQELNARVSQTIATAGNGTIPSELTDMRVSNDGSLYTVAGDYLRNLESLMKIESTLLSEPTNPVIDFYNVTAGSVIPTGSPYRTWGMKIKPSATTINVIKVKINTANVTSGAKLYIEIRDTLNGKLLGKGSGDLSTSKDFCNVILNRDVSLKNGVVISASQVLNNAVIVSPVVRSSDLDTNIDTSTDSGVYYNTTNNVGDSLVAAGSTFRGFLYQMFYANGNVLKRIITNVPTQTPNATTIGGTRIVAKSGGQYSTIQSAVDSAVDGDTILIYPGVYQESVSSFTKELNFVGISKENCIIYDKSANYDTPPLEIGAGMVKNLTIIEDHSEPTLDLAHVNYQKAYCIHVETTKSENNKLIIEDCILRNTKRTAFGIGMYQDFELVIRNCDIWSGAPDRDLHAGAVYFHNRNINANTTNQKIRLINNVVHSDDIIALMIQNVTVAGYVSELECEFINNMFYSSVNGKNCVSGSFSTNIKLAPNSYGNNITMLNA